LKQILKDIFAILNHRERRKLWKLAIADVLISVLDIGFLVGLLYLINFYTQPDRHISSGFISPEIFKQHPLLPIGVFFVLFTVKNLFGFLVSKGQFNFVYGVASRISKDNLLQFLNGNYTDFVQVDSSVNNRRISQQPVEFGHYVLNGMQQVFSQVILVMITVTAMLIYNPLLFPLLMLILVPPVLLIALLMKRRLDATRMLGKTTSEKAIQHLQEALSGYVESNVYQKNDFFTGRYYRFQKQLNHYLSERLIVQSMPPRLIEVFAVFGLFILIVVNYVTAHNHSVQLVTIGALMVAAYKIIPGIVKIMNTVGQIKTYAYATKNLIVPDDSARVPAHGVERLDALAFEKINFSFPEKKVVKNFSLEMKKGDFVGVIGLSGRGKTTFLNLLLGFLTPESGQIFFNGHATDSHARKSFWPRIAYAKQQPFFIHASIIENITLQESGYDSEKLRRILVETGIDKMIDSFHGGLETVITENGKNFSGGQRQRFVFARALYKDADLLILDEPFNELDEPSELQMLHLLKSLSDTGRMIILITHNRTALDFCNQKIRMDEEG
jgi:ABC-type multidrug transport system fused ATPase/permease subunit